MSAFIQDSLHRIEGFFIYYLRYCTRYSNDFGFGLFSMVVAFSFCVFLIHTIEHVFPDIHSVLEHIRKTSREHSTIRATISVVVQVVANVLVAFVLFHKVEYDFYCFGFLFVDYVLFVLDGISKWGHTAVDFSFTGVCEYTCERFTGEFL